MKRVYSTISGLSAITRTGRPLSAASVAGCSATPINWDFDWRAVSFDGRAQGWRNHQQVVVVRERAHVANDDAA